MLNRAVFLDRDGVLNHAIIKKGKPYPPANLDELQIMEDGFAALSRLKAAGFFLICVTNQPDVARGKILKTTVEAINQAISQALPLNEIRVCYHDDDDNCACRKPLPGLLLNAACEHDIALTNSFMIGDRWRDIDAGWRAGCKTILLDYAYQEKSSTIAPDFITTTLTEAVDWIENSLNAKEANKHGTHKDSYN